MKNLAIMAQFPLQIYGSALLFSPSKSVIKNTFYDERPPFIEKITGGVEHWDPCRQTLDRGAGTKALAFSPDDKSFASAVITDEEITVKIWDASIGDCIQVMRINEGGKNVFLAFSSDPNRLVVASKDKARLMDVKTGACKRTIEAPDGAISSIAFSPDGDSFAFTSGCAAQLWDVPTWTHKRALEGHTESVNCVAFAPNSEILATGSNDTTIRVWNRADGSCKKVIEGRSYNVKRVFFSADSRTIISFAYFMRVLDASDGSLKAEHWTESYFDDASVSPDGKVIAFGCIGGKIVFQDVATGEYIQTLYQDGSDVCVAFSKNKDTLISSSANGSVRVWDLSGPPTKSSGSHEQEVRCLHFSQDRESLATGSADKTVKLWNPIDSDLRHTLEGHEGKVGFVAFAPDGKSLASLSTDKTIRIWDTVFGNCRHILKCMSEESELTRIMKMAKASALEQGLELGDDADEDNDEVDDFFDTGPEPVESETATFSPDGNTLAVDAGVGRVMLWDVLTGECKQTLEGDPNGIKWLLFLREGRELVVGGSMGAELWDLDTETRKQKIPETLGAICVSSDEATLVSGASEQALRVWDLATGDCQQTVHVGYDIGSLSFTENDKHLKTNRETFTFNSGVLATSPDPELSQSTIWIEGTWVIRDGKRLLALPPDYPRRLTTIFENTLALGGISGEVAIVEFAGR